MMKKITIPSIPVLLLLALMPGTGRAIQTKSDAVVSPGDATLTAAAGAIILSHERVAGLELSFRVGLLPQLELAAPLGLTFRLVHVPGAGTLYLAAGIADLYFPGYRALVYRPLAMVGGAVYIAQDATLLAAFDISGAEQGFKRSDHPAWLRGSAALVLDLGKTATIAAGVSYQRIVVEGAHPEHLDRTGWAYDARITFGSVQTQPFSELPVLSVHIQPGIDFIVISKIDIDTDTGHRGFRLLAGFELRR